MLPHDDREPYELSEAQEVINLFGLVSPPPAEPISATFRTEVLARIAQQEQPWWRRMWLLPVWTPVLVMGMLLSVTLNVWWGTQGLNTPSQGAPPASAIKALPQLPGSQEAPPPGETSQPPWYAPWALPALAGGLLVSIAANGWLSYQLWKKR